jgi:arylsulfatase A-like enzyme
MILHDLEALNLDEKTVVVFLSDHGYLWGEHGLGGKWLLYEESIRIPLLVRGPGIPEAMRGIKPDHLALNIDVAPTLLDMAGIPIPSEIDGTSLYPLLRGRPNPWRTDFFMEHVDVIDVKRPIPDSRGVRSREWKYIRYVNVEPEIEEIYHLAEDPLETRNLAHDAGHGEIRDRLRARYDYYLNALGSGTRSRPAPLGRGK